MYYKKQLILFICLSLLAIIILFYIYKTFTTEHFYAPIKVNTVTAKKVTGGSQIGKVRKF